MMLQAQFTKIVAIDLNASASDSANDDPEETTFDLESTCKPFSIRPSNSDSRLLQKEVLAPPGVLPENPNSQSQIILSAF